MTDNTVTMLRASVARLLAETVTPARTMEAEKPGIDSALWERFEDLGILGAELGVGLDAKLAVLQETGRAAALVPYAESEILGRWLEDAAKLPVEAGRLAVLTDEVVGRPAPDGTILELRGRIVPWGRHANSILALCRLPSGYHVARLAPDSLHLRHDANMAREPRDIVMAEQCILPAGALYPLPSGITGADLRGLGALCRTSAMLGAMDAATELALRYAQDRKQFGKPISAFQTIQSYLAEMAAEVCASAVAYDLALSGAMAGSWGDTAIAKIRAGQAARVVTRLAHQVHGAIGMTQEYPLHVWTRRLWSWREECGTDSQWARVAGRAVISAGDAGFWPMMTSETLTLGEMEKEI